MTNQNFIQKLRKGQKKGISPVIATIILIAVALVLALVVGVFAFGLFSAQTKTISLQSATLVSGATGALTMVLKDPSAATPSVTSITIDNGAGAVTCTVPAPLPAALTPNGVTPFTCATGSPVIQGSNYDYTVALDNGQAISGSIVAQ